MMSCANLNKLTYIQCDDISRPHTKGQKSHNTSDTTSRDVDAKYPTKEGEGSTTRLGLSQPPSLDVR